MRLYPKVSARYIKDLLSAVEKRAIVQAIDSVKHEPIIKQQTTSASSFLTAPTESNPEAGIYMYFNCIVKKLF